MVPGSHRGQCGQPLRPSMPRLVATDRPRCHSSTRKSEIATAWTWTYSHSISLIKYLFSLILRKLLKQTWSCPSTLGLGSWLGTPAPEKLAPPLLGVCCVSSSPTNSTSTISLSVAKRVCLQPEISSQLDLHNSPHASLQTPAELASWHPRLPSFHLAFGCVCPCKSFLCS